ncbi:MAG: hypothetical protein IPK32_24410 [Verrucomicrobiaceae bacterium]|nr:hypothetical protein [Verrucomicrobiaceae bacterium]
MRVPLDLPDAADIERVFQDMASLVGKAPLCHQNDRGAPLRRVVIQKMELPPPAKQLPACAHRSVSVMDAASCSSPTLESYPGGFLPFDCGNVRSEHPADIYRRHPLFVSLRDNDAPRRQCGRCEFPQCCGGLSGRAYGITGDPFAEDPACL